MPFFRNISWFIFVVCPIAASAAPQPLILEPGGAVDPPEIEVLSSHAGGLDLEFSLSALAVDDVEMDGQEFQLLSIPGGGSNGEIGQPQIPTFARFVAIPDRAGVTITAVIEEETEFSGYHLAPMQGYDDEPFAFDAAAYGRDSFGDPAPASIGDPAIMRDLRIVPLTFHPVRYNPAQGILKVASRIRVEVSFEGENLLNARDARPRPVAPSFDRLYKQTVVNYAGPSAELGMTPGSWIVICRDDSAVTTRLQPLLDWRERQGYTVRLATTSETGTTTSQIKSWIQGQYNTMDPPPEYIVIAGDSHGSYSIACWFDPYQSGEGDHGYVELEGGDVLPDAHVGRLSFEDLTQLELIVDKIIHYETTPELGDPDWFKRACLVGDPSSSGMSCVFVQQWVKERLRDYHGYTQIDTIYNQNAGSWVSQMETSLDQGTSVFSYRGYLGMSNWENSNTYTLANGYKMPFAVVITCGTGDFHNATSRSEGFLRAHWTYGARGGIGSIGTATWGTHTRYNNCMHYGIFYGLLWEDQFNLGAALSRGKLEMFLNYYEREPSTTVSWLYWNNLMGGPATECWTGYPTALTVTHDADVPLGSNSFTVSVDKLGLPVEGAQVCLLKKDQTHVVGFTDEQGEIELPLSVTSPGNLDITVTKHNCHPYLATVPVASENVYVGYESHSVDDDTSDDSDGNGNGDFNPGETIELVVELKNFGVQTAYGVTATLTCSDPYVTITDNEELFGNITGGSTALCPDDFDLALDTKCPHGHVIRLGLEVSSGANQWHSLIDLPVVSADLFAEGTTVHDGGDGRLDPGETVDLSVKLANRGGEDATNVSGILTSLSSFVSVIDGAGSWGTIAEGANVENTSNLFTVSASEDTYEGFLATFQLVTTYSGGLQDTTTTSVTVGQRSSDDPVGPDTYGYYAFDNTDTSYPEAPTYEWIEIDPDYGGSGEIVPLYDDGTYQDDSVVIDLPFLFYYYGEAFAKATVCSNGWMTMGETWLVNYRNWTIPGAGGPDGIIAVFWDDLNLSGEGEVYKYYDAANHRFIVEWSRVRNEPGGTQTVEAIFYDPAHHPTPSGDGLIVMQYHTVNNNDSGDNYCTVGIESPDSYDGLLYSFSNLYPAGAATLTSGRAIRFIPVRDVPSGTITGVVRNDSYGGTPLPDAEVYLQEIDRTLITAADGSYGGSAPANVYTVTASHPGFEPFTVWGVPIVVGEQTELDFDLTDNSGPIITFTPHGSTDDTVGPYTIPVTINEYSGLDATTLYYMTDGVNFTPIDLTPLGGENYLAEIPGQEYGRMVQYYVYARDGIGQESSDPPGAPDELYSFLVTPTISLFADDMEADQGWTVGGPDDDATTGIWERADPIGTDAQPEDDHTPIGVNCFVTDGRGGAQGDYDVDGGQTTLTSPLLDLTSFGTVHLRYYRWYSNDTGNNPGQDVWVAQVSDDDGAGWVTLENTNLSDRSWLLREFTLNDYIEITDSVRIRFIASDEGLASLIEAGVDDLELVLTGLTVDSPDAPIAPLHVSLMPSRPNPSREGTTISFSLTRSGEARLAIYDVQGRLVRNLMDGWQRAGRQSVVWDGRDDKGADTPSGIYMYRLDAEGNNLVRKLIRLQ